MTQIEIKNELSKRLSPIASTGTTAIRRIRRSHPTVRLTALLLLAALLTPVVFFDPSPAVAASLRSAPVINNAIAPTSVAAPPEVFAASPSVTSSFAGTVFNGLAAPLVATGGKIADGYESAVNVVAPPALPEGFENAVLPTFGERVARAFSSSAAASEASPFTGKKPSAVAEIPRTVKNGETAGADVSNATEMRTAGESGTNDTDSNAVIEAETISETNAETNVEPPAPPAPVPTTPGIANFDFNGDGKADVARFQSASNLWTIKNSGGTTVTATTLGTSGAVIVPADYDGDGTTDRAVWNQYSADWTIIKSSTGATQTVSAFGANGDIPVPADYSGTGTAAELALFRPSNGTWYFYRLSDGQATSAGWGQAGDVPVPGDYNGDGKADLAVFRPSNSQWYILMPGNGGSYTYFQWGLGSDVPVPADYTGDGVTDYAVYRPSNGTWYIQPMGGGTYISKTWGNYGDQPVPADYDGDGKADLAVWRPTSGVWYIVKSSVAGMTTYVYDQLGIPGDTAVSSAYVKKVSGAVPPGYLAMARLHPRNATGGTDLYSRNFSWGTSLVNLPGRAGLDAGFGISYNSLVWTKEPLTNTMVFDADYSNVSPGFRLGFPTIEPSYYNPLTQQFSYLMVTPSGGRIEFRQTAASNVYETADSNYAQLTVTPGQQNQGTESSSLLVRTTDGTMMTYVWRAGSYRLSEIKDRNGNYITVVHDVEYGLLRSLTDTLGRVVTVEYDSDFAPIAVKQDRKTNNGTGSTVSHTYATFTYTAKEITPNFASGINVFGPSGGAYIKVLDQIIYPTGARTAFDYNAYGQVSKARNFAADLHELNYVRTDLQTPAANQTDCPRFSETRSWTEKFNLDAQGVEQETVIHNTLAVNVTYTGGGESLGATDVTEVWMEVAGQTGIADVHSKTWYHTAGTWNEGLPLGTEEIADGVRKRWTRATWIQDDPTKIYKVNPRVEESRVGDDANIKKTKIEYLLQAGGSTVSKFGLVAAVRSYDTNQTTVLKKAVTDYNLDQAYLDRRIIGLPKEQRLYEGEYALQSKVTYNYDQGDFNDTSLQQNVPSAIRHDDANYGASFIAGRGNPTSVTRCDVAISSDTVCGGGIASQTIYNTAGAAVAQIDPLGRTVKIGYQDSFNDGGNGRNTFAYPTRLTEVANTDASNNFSLVNYRYDTGANVWAKSPSPPVSATNTSGIGKISERLFDGYGRMERERVIKGGAEYGYVRYEYPTSQTQSKVYSVITAGAGEVLSESWTDGAGRVRQSKTELPNSGGHYTGSLTEYDILGRVKRSSVPTEITIQPNGDWTPAGEDALYGWLWNSAEYDWKGRATREINSDGTDKTVSYEGCGCAGGQITTVRGEEIFETDWQGNNPVSLGRRTQKIYQDIQGRTVKTQVLDFDGATVHSTIDTIYNGRDQATSVTRTDSGTPPVAQVTTMSYDGHGRLQTQHRPEQNTGNNTIYYYNADDRLSSVVDARGAATNYVYNGRGLVEQIYYSAPAAASPEEQIRIPATGNFSYDALGNRTAMTETTNPAAGGIGGLGGTTYAYDSLSRLTSETRSFNDAVTGFNQSFTFNYEYNLAGQLTEFIDPNDPARNVSYPRDKIGRVTAVKNTGPTRFNNVEDYATDIQYRAFGAVKSLVYGATGVGKQLTQTFNNRLQLAQFNVSGGGDTFRNLGSTNKYYADGRVKSAADTYNNKFDRSYQYDYAGRIKKANTGGNARDPQNGQYDGPYQQTYNYNDFGNLTNRTGFNWNTGLDSQTATYTNNRNNDPNWYYDADGRTVVGEVAGAFDAAGRRFATYSDVTVMQTFDGDGRRVKQSENYGPTEESAKNRYYIQSSVLGTVYEIEKSGASWVKRTGMVYLNGQRIAIQNLGGNTTQTVWWIYENPVTGATRGTTSKLASEPDPLGVNNGLQPAPQQPEYGEGVPDLIIPRFGDALNLAAGCTIDGMQASCDLVNSMLENGSAQQVHDYIIAGNVSIGGTVVGSALFSLYGVGDLPSRYSVEIPPMAFQQAYNEGSGNSPAGMIRSHNGIPRDKLPQDSRGGQPPIRHPEREIFKIKSERSIGIDRNSLVDDNLSYLDQNKPCEDFLNLFLSTLASVTGVKQFGNIRQILTEFKRRGNLQINDEPPSDPNASFSASGNTGGVSGTWFVYLELGHIMSVGNHPTLNEAASWLSNLSTIRHEVIHASEAAYGDAAYAEAGARLGISLPVADFMKLNPNLTKLDAQRILARNVLWAGCNNWKGAGIIAK